MRWFKVIGEVWNRPDMPYYVHNAHQAGIRLPKHCGPCLSNVLYVVPSKQVCVHFPGITKGHGATSWPRVRAGDRPFHSRVLIWRRWRMRRRRVRANASAPGRRLLALGREVHFLGVAGEAVLGPASPDRCSNGAASTGRRAPGQCAGAVEIPGPRPPGCRAP